MGNNNKIEKYLQQIFKVVIEKPKLEALEFDKLQQINSAIQEATDFNLLAENSELRNRINDLKDHLLPNGKKQGTLQSLRKSRYEKLVKINEEAKKKSIGELMEESKKICSDFETSQEKIRATLQELVKRVEKMSRQKDQTNEYLMIESFSLVVEKLENVKRAIQLSEEISNSYLKNKNIPKEEIELWLSELRKLKDSKEVAQYMQKND